MFFTMRSRHRDYHLGPFPLETLAHDSSILETEAERPAAPRGGPEGRPEDPLGKASRRYRDLFAEFRFGEPAPALAPLPDDLGRRAADIKGGAYFLNASQVGICRIPALAWLKEATPLAHEFAVVVLVEHGRVPEPANPAHGWVAPAVLEAGAMRALEIAVCLARHIRMMGLRATAHGAGCSALDLPRLAVLAGLAVRAPGEIVNPYLGRDFSLAVVSTAYELALDSPLAPGVLGQAKGIGYWLGRKGAESGRERRRRAKRASHLSRYPMEQVKRVERPTTIILDDEVPRVPKRAAFFERALKGDLGAKSQRERGRFALKHPLAWAMGGLLRAMVPLQDGPLAEATAAGLGDAAANARALKSLAYFLGADLAGICEIPRYAWFSHHGDGGELRPYHRYAVVMLIDQEHDQADHGDFMRRTRF